MSSLTGISFPSAASYTFLREIGRGGMGIVYLAEKHSEGVSDLVVLKTIRTMRRRQIERLKREANIAATLRHENIVRTYGLEAIPFDRLPEAFMEDLKIFVQEDESSEPGAGSGPPIHIRMGVTHCLEADDGGRSDRTDGAGAQPLYLIVMEYVEGRDLRTIYSNHIKAGLLMPVKLGAFVISRLCRALDYAHRYIVHRDISPENILINDQGVTKLMDFGLAVAADQEAFGLAGKIQYMAPEQVEERAIDSRSDIFALGLVAYQLSTGVRLFLPPRGLSFHDQAADYRQRLRTAIVPPHEVCRDVPGLYSEMIMKMLAVDPDRRYQRIDRLGSEIEKRFIYAEGFGPTNNSLEAYLKHFETDFAGCSAEEMGQLAFLTDADRNLDWKRRIGRALYTDRGLAVIKARR